MREVRIYRLDRHPSRWRPRSFVQSCARLPRRTRLAIAYIIEQAIELERQGQEDRAIEVIEAMIAELGTPLDMKRRGR